MIEVAKHACTGCNGTTHHVGHSGSNYRVKGMSRFDRTGLETAVAVFYLTRGAVVVSITGNSQKCWWLPTYEQADDFYEASVWPEFCKLRSHGV